MDFNRQRSKLTVRYCNIQLKNYFLNATLFHLKGLSHEMDLAFDDMLG
jgi:hypothetical protein